MKKMCIYLFSTLFLLSGCFLESGPATPPAEAVTTFLAYVKAGEYLEANSLVLGEYQLQLDEIEEEHQLIFKNLSYDNIIEEINGNSATVSLTINNSDFAEIMEAVMNEAFTNWIFMYITEQELIEKMDAFLVEKMTADTVPITSRDVTVTLEVFENQWKIVADDNFIDAVVGGLLSLEEYAYQW